MKKKLNERAYIIQLIKRFRDAGCFAHKVVERFAAGFPDLIVITPTGKVLFIEVKIKNNNPTMLQQHFLDMINEHRGNAVVITQIDFDHAIVTVCDEYKRVYSLDQWFREEVKQGNDKT